jgi:cytochrome c oxidase subunit 2
MRERRVGLRHAGATAAGAATALLVVLAIPDAVLADALTPESGGSSNADEIDSLYKIVFAVAIVVFVAVEGTLVYSLVRFRARRGHVAAQIRGNTRLEIGWTLAATLLLVGLTTITFTKLDAIAQPPGAAPAVFGATGSPPSSHPALRIEVSGQQYIWSFRYANGLVVYEELVVPTNTTVELDIISRDVAHSWWIPKLGGKADAVPGYTNHTWFRIPRPGLFRGQCAELCGRNHADMVAHVRALAPARYRAWMAATLRDTAEARRG